MILRNRSKDGRFTLMNGFHKAVPHNWAQPFRTRDYALLVPPSTALYIYTGNHNQVTGYPTQQAVLEIFLDPLKCIYPTQLRSLVTKPVGPLSTAAYYLGTI